MQNRCSANSSDCNFHDVVFERRLSTDGKSASPPNQPLRQRAWPHRASASPLTPSLSSSPLPYTSLAWRTYARARTTPAWTLFRFKHCREQPFGAYAEVEAQPQATPNLGSPKGSNLESEVTILGSEVRDSGPRASLRQWNLRYSKSRSPQSEMVELAQRRNSRGSEVTELNRHIIVYQVKFTHWKLTQYRFRS